MKKTIFAAGIVSGFILAKHWRSLTKEGLKMGISASHKLQELGQKAREEIEDVAAEVEAEMAEDSTTSAAES